MEWHLKLCHTLCIYIYVCVYIYIYVYVFGIYLACFFSLLCSLHNVKAPELVMDAGCRDNRWTASLCMRPARRWVALELRSAWLDVDTQVKACSRETHSPSRASKTYGHNAFQITHIHTTVINSGRAHTTQHRTHCGL